MSLRGRHAFLLKGEMGVAINRLACSVYGGPLVSTAPALGIVGEDVRKRQQPWGPIILTNERYQSWL